MTKMTLAYCLLLALARPTDPTVSPELVAAFSVTLAPAFYPGPTFFATPDPSYTLISAPDNTFGYDIYVHGRRLIHQTTIPGLPGVRGFVRKKDAEKVAALVIQKLEHHILPPAVSRHEMDSLQIKF